MSYLNVNVLCSICPIFTSLGLRAKESIANCKPSLLVYNTPLIPSLSSQNKFVLGPPSSFQSHKITFLLPCYDQVQDEKKIMRGDSTFGES